MENIELRNQGTSLVGRKSDGNRFGIFWKECWIMGKWDDYQGLILSSVNTTHMITLSLKKIGASTMS